MRKFILPLAGALSLILFSPQALAIPSFSRQASMTCKACHTQHAPILNGFGQAFKAGGYPIMGTQGKVEGERLSIPNTLNASMLLKMRYQQSNGTQADTIPGDSTNSGQWQLPDELSLYFGGRIAETVGFFFEGNTSANNLIAGFKLPAAVYIADAKFSVIPFLTDGQGASYGYEQSSTGAARNVIWGEHRKEISAQQYIGTDTPATGLAIVAQNDIGYFNLSRWAPAFMGRKDGAQVLRSTYLRIVATPTVTTLDSDWSIQTGVQIWRGTNYAYDTLTLLQTPLDRPLKQVATNATAFDFQAIGQIDGRDLSLYATWAIAPGGTAARPNILNAGRAGTNPPGPAEPAMYRVNDRRAWTIGAEYSVIQGVLHLGAAYRSAQTGGAHADPNAVPVIIPVAGDSQSDNAITLTGVYNLTQNIELHLNQTFYRGSLYNTRQPMGNQLTTFMLEAAW